MFDVPGARLYYERRGSGPLLVLIVVAAGATSRGQLANRAAVVLAAQLGTPVAEFPGDHGGFAAFPEQFGRVLDQVLTQPA